MLRNIAVVDHVVYFHVIGGYVTWTQILVIRQDFDVVWRISGQHANSSTS